MRPLIALDLDDTICLNNPYGGYDVMQPIWPSDLATRLWHPPALDVLRPIVAELNPQIVITSSWLRVMELAAIDNLFRVTGAAWLADVLHPEGEPVQNSGWTRVMAIEDWLARHHRGEPYVVIDDPLSGTGLEGSRHDVAGRLVLCEVNVGLLPVHGVRIRNALTQPIA